MLCLSGFELYSRWVPLTPNLTVLKSFLIVRKSLATFAIFGKLADFAKPFLTFSLSKCRILSNFFVLAIFATFVTQSFHIARKSLVTFAIFAKFADFSKPFLTFSLSKCRIFLNLLFLHFLPYLLLNLFT